MESNLFSFANQYLSLFGARINVAAHDLGRYIAHLSENTEIFLIGDHVVIIADQ